MNRSKTMNKQIDPATKIGFAFTCKLNLAHAAHDAMLDDRYSDALAALAAGGKSQLANELQYMMRRAGI